jgi:phage-related protein
VAEVASAFVTLIPSFRGGERRIADELNGPLDRAGRDGGGRFGTGMAAGIGGMASKIFAPLAAGLAALGIGQVLSESVQMASALEQSIGGVDAIFKETSATVHEFAKGAATDLGLSQNSYNELAAIIGTTLKNSGTSMEDLAGETDKLIGIAADLSATFGGTVVEASGAMASALRGEFEPLRRYGVSLDQATIQARALADTGKTSASELTKNEKALATQALILEQSADATGAFAREADTLAGKQERLKAQVENVKTELGTRLLPVMSAVSGFLLENMMPAFDTIAGGAKALAAAFEAGGSDVTSSGFAGIMERIGLAARAASDWFAGTLLPALREFAGFVTGTVVPIVRALADAFVANVMPIIAQLVAFVQEHTIPAFRAFSAFIREDVLPVVQRMADFFTSNIAPAIATVAGYFSGVLLPALLSFYGVISDNVVPVLRGLWQNFQENILPALESFFSVITGKVVPVLVRLGSFIVPIIQAIAEWAVKIGAFLIPVMANLIGPILGGLISAIGSLIGWIFDGISAVIDFAESFGEALGKALDFGKAMLEVGRNLLEGLIDGIKDKVGDAVRAVKEAVGKVIDGAKSVLGIASPSKVFMEIGRFTGEGLARGIDSQKQSVQDSMNSILDIPTARSLNANLAGVGGNAATAAGGAPLDYDRLARAIAGVNLNLTLDGQRMAASMDQRLGAAIRG